MPLMNEWPESAPLPDKTAARVFTGWFPKSAHDLQSLTTCRYGQVTFTVPGCPVESEAYNASVDTRHLGASLSEQ